MREELNLKHCEICNNEFNLDCIDTEDFIMVPTGECFCIECFKETENEKV